MSRIVLDSGILIASVFPEQITQQAQLFLRRLQDKQAQPHAPYLFHYEIVTVSRKIVYQKRVTLEKGSRGCEQLLAYPIALHVENTLLKTAYQLATQYIVKPTFKGINWLGNKPEDWEI
jgi:predicted nucleic acid-binding protein